ncbi:MAG: polyprenol monophosphomannose synthase [Planctomycetes bacterium]|nr:polyprenol monophosphomannose synthase [Planctomycetota bacterium]
MRAVVVLPTYDERENLPRAAAGILGLPGEWSLLVVDDASPDGTGAVADGIARAHPGRVEVLHRERKEGLGRAYAAGFARALAGGADLVFQMDADLSHDPSALPSLRGPLERGEADLVLGSRYVPGGGTAGWGLGRRLLSRWGSFYARAWLRLPLRDLTGGFKGWRADLLRRVDPGRTAAKGYAFQVETTYRAVRAGARVLEVPIRFAERDSGRSKMSLPVALEAAWRVPLLALLPPPRGEGAP